MGAKLSRKDAAKIVGITDRTVWYYTEMGLVVPEVHNPRGKGTTRLYSRRNLMELLVIKRLAKHGLSLEVIASIIKGPKIIGSDGFDPWDPDCTVVSNRRFFLVVADVATDHIQLTLTGAEAGGQLKLDPGFECALVVDLTAIRSTLG